MLGTEDELIARYAPLVRRLALQLVARLPANVELDDLMQAGMIGLLDAVRRYEVKDDATFDTYATTRVRGAMLDELRSQDWLSRGARSKAREIDAAVLRVQQRELRAAQEQEIADELGVSLDDYYAMLEDASGVQLVHYEDLSGRDGDDIEALERMASDVEDPAQHQDNPLNLLMSQNLHAAVVQAIEALPEREKLLLSLQFEHDLNQKEIAAVMGVSEGRISQLRSQAVARIRARLKA
jgi:RNA polymerase sigma factor, FliA/WhiG family